MIGSNLRRMHLERDAHVVRADVVSYLEGGTPAERTPYRACVIDPPYEDVVIERTLELLGDAARRWLTDDAVVVAKHFWRDDPPERAGRLERTRQRRFGETMLSFYTPTEEGR